MFNPKLLSIDIGTKNIKFIEVKHSGKKATVDKTFSIKTPENCFNDGEIVNMIAIKEEIEKALKEYKIKTKNAVIACKSTSLITRIIEVPFQKKMKGFDSLVSYEIQQYLPINLEDFIVQYRKLEEFERDGNKMCNVRVTVYPKIMAKAYLDLLKELKLTPTALDVSSNCITKLFSGKNILINNENVGFDETVVVIDMGSDFIEFNVISEGQLKFTRILSGGGSYLDANIASQLSMEESEAEQKKIEMCNLNTDNVSNYSETEEEQINGSIKLVVDRWINEIYRLLDYYRNTNREIKIKKIYLYGGCSNLKGLASYMEASFNISTVQINNMGTVNFVGSAVEAPIEEYLNAVGSSIRLK